MTPPLKAIDLYADQVIDEIVSHIIEDWQDSKWQAAHPQPELDFDE